MSKIMREYTIYVGSDDYLQSFSTLNIIDLEELADEYLHDYTRVEGVGCFEGQTEDAMIFIRLTNGSSTQHESIIAFAQGVKKKLKQQSVLVTWKTVEGEYM